MRTISRRFKGRARLNASLVHLPHELLAKNGEQSRGQQPIPQRVQYASNDEVFV